MKFVCKPHLVAFLNTDRTKLYISIITHTLKISMAIKLCFKKTIVDEFDYSF